MKTNKFLILATLLVGLLITACTNHDYQEPYYGGAGLALPPTSIIGNDVSKAGPTTDHISGSNQTGVLIPTTEGVVGRIENGLERNVSSMNGNFRTSLTQLRTNLPKNANVTTATGYDQVQLLAYSACSDLTTGGTPRMQSVYNVQPNASAASNQVALVAAGVRMLDQHTAGLASRGPAAAQVITILTNLVQTEAAVPTNTSRMVFMTVCVAVNTAGSAMLGL